MDSKRRCTRNSCERPAVATLTYSYQDSTVVVGPMSLYAEPHTYDLCSEHADRVNPPRGWEVLRLEYSGAPAEEGDDLLALADAVRSPRAHTDAAVPAGSAEESTMPGSAALPTRESRTPLAPPHGDPGIARGHLRLIRE